MWQRNTELQSKKIHVKTFLDYRKVLEVHNIFTLTLTASPPSIYLAEALKHWYQAAIFLKLEILFSYMKRCSSSLQHWRADLARTSCSWHLLSFPLSDYMAPFLLLPSSPPPAVSYRLQTELQTKINSKSTTLFWSPHYSVCWHVTCQ